MDKITIIGDIMCEPLLLKAAYHNGTYDFSQVFAKIKERFAESDYVIGNLETPLAGSEAVFTDSLFVFNTPDEFADALKAAGIDFVLTANNHCLDRGIAGLERTLRVLDDKEIPHTGTYLNKPDDGNAYVTVGDTRVAIISYTYGTNYAANRLMLSENESYKVNLLRPQPELYFVPQKSKRTLKQRVIWKFLRMFPEEKQYYVKKYLGMRVNVAHADDHLNKDTAAPYMEKMQKDIGAAKSKADLVLFCPHIGGQFNAEPGAFSEYVFEEASKAGCDAIVASHAHVVLKTDKINGIPSFYSLGNFSMSPNSVYLVRDQKPEYGHCQFKGRYLLAVR